MRLSQSGFWLTSVASLFLAMAVPATANHDPAHGVDPHQGHGEHGAASSGPAAKSADAPLSEASKAFESAMQKMHREMAVPYSNNVDVDFVRGMIPHHQGAIEQAEVLLKYSKNPMLRRLAGGIIATQKREIRFMNYWLKEHAKGIQSGDMPVWLREQPDPLEGNQPEADATPDTSR